MVKRVAKDSVSEDEIGSANLNNNGKRPSDVPAAEPKKRLKTKSLYRQPTANELNRLQETENLFNSNLFRLQVEEILQEVQVKEKTEKKFQVWFTDFKKHLLSIPNGDTEYDLSEPALAKKLKVKIPVCDKLSKTKCSFRFYKFKDVEIVGSYALGCAISSKLCINVQITVPSETYTKNDSINYRYHKKRAAYLAVVASHIKNHESVENVNYACLFGTETKPVLDLTPAGKLSKYLAVRIDLACEDEAYKLHRFSPLRNNLREAWFFGDDGSDSTEVGPPTPYYNSSVLQDLTAGVNQEFLKETLLNKENLKQAVVLLKIWIRQRNLQVSGHVISLLVSNLVQTKRINNIMSSYQIVRNVWIALKTSEWDSKGISLYKGDNTPSLEDFHQHFPVVFLDRTGYYNVCWQMCKGTYDALRRESALAVEMLDNGKINSFLPLFMAPVKPLTQFDQILKFKKLQQVKDSVISKLPKPTRVNYGLDTLPLVTDSLHSLLSKGLGNRVELVLQMVDAAFSWPVKSSLEKAKKECCKEDVSFGFILNAENCLNTVEKGPPANFPEAEQFRAFWGDKSELRRFQDGSITEAVVWDAPDPRDRRALTQQILDYLLNLKFGIQPSELFHIGSQLESLVFRKQYGVPTEDAASTTIRAFDELRRDLRQLQQLPLDIGAVYGVSPVFSYSEPAPPLARPHGKPWRRGGTSLVKHITREDGSHVLPEYVPVCKAVIELGHSGKWPGDIQAFRCLKAAFHLQIADRLHKQYSLPAHPYPTHVDVLKNGLVFRLEIAHPKEITLLRKEMENGVAKFRESEESIKLQCETVLMPRLRGALHGLHQKHSSFGPTACIFKRWLAAHLLSPPHFPAPLADLLVAAVYLRAHPLTPPNMPTVGLMRVLKMVAETDRSREMIVLDFNEDMKREEIMDLECQFANRENQTAKIYVVTAYDGDLPSVWSTGAPSPQVLARVRTLAASTLKYFEDGLMSNMKDNLLAAFVPSLAGYDVLIHLHPDLVPLAPERVDRPPLAPRDAGDTELIPVVEFHVVDKYLHELRSAYDEFALFFHDTYGGDVIAVLWKPDIRETKEFQLLNANALKPVTMNGEVKYEVNIGAIVEDFRILGEGLVKEVVVN